MYRGVVLYLVIVSLAIANGNLFDFGKLQNFTTRFFSFSPNASSGNDLWHGIIKDCSKQVTFSCIQKNAYTFLDKTLVDRDNITVFDGVHLTRNNLDYDACVKDDPEDNLVEDANGSNEGRKSKDKVDENEEEEEEYLSPLEEVTHALRKKTVRFLATRDYQIQLPRFIGAGANIKISPREIDERGALIRVDFGGPEEDEQQHGRLFFKKIKKQIQNKIFTTLLLLILLIKIIKLKFFFVVPFLFGVGTAKKLFLKMLLFFVPAFAHVFKLCSSYYSSHATKYHLHHHKQIAHHHHHIPVPVPVPYSKPVYYDHPPPSHSSSHGSSPPYILDEDFNGYDYAHPHIQYRKDIEELKEWGIEPYEEGYDQAAPQAGVIYPGTTPPSGKPGMKMPFAGMPPPPPGFPGGPKPPPGFPDRMGPIHPQNLPYGGYGPPPRHPAASLPIGVVAASGFGPAKPPVTPPTKPQNFAQQFTPQQEQPRPVYNQQRVDLQQQPSAPAPAVPVAMPPTRKPYDDDFYGPIVERLDEIFAQLRFLEETCRERLVCSMYKNPALYSPHSNLVSNELSRDPQELQQGNSASASSQRFYRYLNAARLGQDGGDCLRAFHCNINTE